MPGSAWHFAGAVMYFIAGAAALLLLGVLWLRQTPLGWFILACGGVSAAALVTAAVTGMHVPEPGTLERLMGYPITIGLAAAGLVIAQRVRQDGSAQALRGPWRRASAGRAQAAGFGPAVGGRLLPARPQGTRRRRRPAGSPPTAPSRQR